MNREGIRRLAAEELGLPTSPYAFATSAAELAEAAHRIGLPVFIKPVMSSSGKGQSMIDAIEDAANAWAYAQSSGRVETATVIVEGRIDFDFEITLLTVRSLRDGAVRSDFCAPIGHRQDSDPKSVRGKPPLPVASTPDGQQAIGSRPALYRASSGPCARLRTDISNPAPRGKRRPPGVPDYS
jgi:formate-dependent phosphoribosylglycinamide formyltransferase (GAR transformylase)